MSQMVFLVLYDVHQQLHNQFTIEPQETINKSTITEFGNNSTNYSLLVSHFRRERRHLSLSV